MGKIEALKVIDKEIEECVNRIKKNTVSVKMTDIFFLTDKFNEVNTSKYKHKDVSGCIDCRNHVFKFWLNVIDTWKEQKQSK